jgi:hypothetical protein
MNTYSKTLLAILVVGSLAVLAPVASAQTTLGFGTQVKLGDVDFVPTAATASIAYAAGQVKAIDFGITGQVTDDCFYLDRGAVDGTAIVLTAVRNFDVRLTPCQGKAAGTLVGDSDTVEKATASVAADDLGLLFADVNNNGRYDLNDQVYLSTSATTLVASTASASGTGAWTLRLTAAGGKAAGTLVFASDSDFVSYNAAVLATGAPSWVFFDADNTATLTTGDVVYETPIAVLINQVYPQYSVRISGTPTASGPNPGGNPNPGTSMTSTSSTGTNSTMSSTSHSGTGSTMSSTSHSGTGSTGSSSSGKSKTPGFELVALVGALGAALILVRRKL